MSLAEIPEEAPQREVVDECAIAPSPAAVGEPYCTPEEVPAWAVPARMSTPIIAKAKNRTRHLPIEVDVTLPILHRSFLSNRAATLLTDLPGFLYHG